jgi:hypothetical protein
MTEKSLSNRNREKRYDEWHNQQDYIAANHEHEYKHEIADEATKAIAETYTAANDILRLLIWHEDPEKRKEVEIEQKKDWEQASRKWRIASRTLLPKLEAHFKDRIIHETFENIIVNRKQLGNLITNLLDQPEKKADKDHPSVKRAQELINQVIEPPGHLRTLITAMVKEIQEPHEKNK